MWNWVPDKKVIWDTATQPRRFVCSSTSDIETSSECDVRLVRVSVSCEDDGRSFVHSEYRSAAAVTMARVG